MQRLVNAFPLWVLAASLAALAYPPWITWFAGPLITAALGLIMLGMGLTLRGADFGRVLAAPRLVAAGVGLQFTVMPALGFAIGKLLELPPQLAAGLVLVACCPGGTASNVVAFLARAHVALSVTMTAVSTFAAVGLTPLLTSALVGSRVPVDAWGLLWSTLQVVVVPVAAGLLLRHGAPRLSARILPFAPLAAVVLVSLIVASIIGANRDAIFQAGPRLLAAILGLHGLGFAAGYLLARLFRAEILAARTIAIEVGMQNSGLGVVLAAQNFTSPLVAIPSALSSLVHALLGSALAGWWRSRSSARGSLPPSM